jgi:hypothetical protein
MPRTYNTHIRTHAARTHARTHTCTHTHQVTLEEFGALMKGELSGRDPTEAARAVFAVLRCVRACARVCACVRACACARCDLEGHTRNI